jgi:hypothetical protein
MYDVICSYAESECSLDAKVLTNSFLAKELSDTVSLNGELLDRAVTVSSWVGLICIVSVLLVEYDEFGVNLVLGGVNNDCVKCWFL